MANELFLGFPNPLASEVEKDKPSYGLQFFQMMYREWAGESGTLLDQRVAKWQLCRDYAGGKQSSQPYKDLLGVDGDKSYANLDWRIVPVIPKFVDIIVNSLINYGYTINASAIDPVSSDQRRGDALKMKAKLLSQNFLLEVEKQTNIPLLTQDNTQLESNEEIDLFMRLSYKQAAEIAIENGVMLAMNINDWREISKRILRDLVVIGIGAAKCELDYRGITLRYVDPINMVTSYSDAPDFKKMTYCGEVIRISISELKSTAGDQFTEAEYLEIARNFAGRNNNKLKFRAVANVVNGIQYYEYDNFLVDILDAQFIVPVDIKYEKKSTNYGTYSVNKRKGNYTIPKESKESREMIQTSYDCKYSGKWIIGTRFVYGYGKGKNQIRPKSALSKTFLDYIVYTPNLDLMRNQSLCERMIPFGDQIQLTHLKIQHIAAKSRPKGLAIELGAIESVSDGKGGTFKPLDILDIFDQTGVYHYRELDDEGRPSQSRPVTELAGGIGGALNELLALYQHNIGMLRDVTGINEARDGSASTQNAAIGIQKMNLEASNNATKYINDAYLNIYKRTAESVILMLQDLVEYDRVYSGYISALGEMSMETITISKDVSIYEFGIIIDAEPTDYDKQVMEQNIQQSLQQKELRIEDAIFIRRIKNIKMANEMIMLRRKKYADELRLVAQQNAQMNAEQSQIAAQQAAQAKQMELEMDLQNSIKKMQAEYEMKNEFEIQEHARAMELQELVNRGKVESNKSNTSLK